MNGKLLFYDEWFCLGRLIIVRSWFAQHNRALSQAENLLSCRPKSWGRLGRGDCK